MSRVDLKDIKKNFALFVKAPVFMRPLMEDYIYVIFVIVELLKGIMRD